MVILQQYIILYEYRVLQLPNDIISPNGCYHAMNGGEWLKDFRGAVACLNHLQAEV